MQSTVRSAQLAQKAILGRLASRPRRGPVQAGFTLIELLIVVIIIGILAAISLPAFLNQQNRARANAADDSVMNAARSCAALQVTETTDKFDLPNGVAGDCGDTTAARVFTSTTLTPDTEAVATLETTGKAALTTCGQKGNYLPVLDATSGECKEP